MGARAASLELVMPPAEVLRAFTAPEQRILELEPMNTAWNVTITARSLHFRQGLMLWCQYSALGAIVGNHQVALAALGKPQPLGQAVTCSFPRESSTALSTQPMQRREIHPSDPIWSQLNLTH